MFDGLKAIAKDIWASPVRYFLYVMGIVLVIWVLHYLAVAIGWAG